MRIHQVKCDRCGTTENTTDVESTPDGWVSIDAESGGYLGIENKTPTKGINYTNAFKGHHWCSAICMVKWLFGEKSEIRY